ncbi:MAG TPA: hypothetical protein VML75_15030 [Kofleriaceae bacterium]|nr:hypothetical protein [Kofleriaceae bacterium]
MVAIRRTRSWRIEQPLPNAGRTGSAGAGALLVAAVVIALFYLFFV